MKEIPLTRGLVAFVDDEDHEELAKYRWYAEPSGYAKRIMPKNPDTGRYPRMGMHRQIMGPDISDARIIDHIDRNPLNNQRSNLRICDATENAINRSVSIKNTSGYKGVSWHRQDGRWKAQIQVNHKKIVIGYFDTPEAAYEAYCVKAKELHGDFALTEVKAVADAAVNHIPYAKRMNKTGLKGVKRCTDCDRWSAQIMRNGERRHLGQFMTAEEAHEAYCRAANETRSMQGMRKKAA